MKDSFSKLLKKRRSIRKFTTDKLQPDEVETILKAGLMSPTSKNSTSWEFIAIEDKVLLDKLSQCKKGASSFISKASLAVVVIANPIVSDVWIEDASIASIMMQMQAESLGIGSCWVQIRERQTKDETPSSAYVQDLLDIPMPYEVLSIIAFGYKEQEKPPFDEEKLQWEKIHINKFTNNGEKE